MPDAMIKSQKDQRALSQWLRVRRTLLASHNALRVLPKPLKPGRGPLVRVTHAQESLRKSRMIQPVLPRRLQSALLSKELIAERGLSRWMTAQRIYTKNMTKKYGLDDYFLDNDLFGDEDELMDESASAAWVLDQNDPDNWAVIPEFDVKPQAVDFQGFRYPIVYPGIEDREAADSIRTMLRIGRKKIRTEFTTRSALNEKALEAYDMDRHEWTALHLSAFTFRLLEVSIENSIKDSLKPSIRFSWLASAGAILTAWMSDDADEISNTLSKVKTVHDTGKIGGVRSAIVRQENACNKDAVVGAAKELGWPAKRYGILKKLGADFDCTASYIGEILKEKSITG